MLSYQHVFHAGNHADILKHYVLIFTLNALNKKEKTYTFFDTHAGSGLYDFFDNRSLKTGEAEKGILYLLENIKNQAAEIPSLCDYVDFVKKYTSKNLYPGSPEIERSFLRNQDFLVLSELHPAEYENLCQNIKKDSKNIQINNKNGFKVLTSLTPPVTKRGAVLIDPSYEEKQDYEDAAQTIINVHKKWSNGIILLWYPLLLHRTSDIQLMKEKIENAVKNQNQNTEIVDLQLLINTPDSHREVSLEDFEKDKKNPPRLYGSGMYVINAPWHLAEEGQKTVNLLQKMLFQK